MNESPLVNKAALFARVAHTAINQRRKYTGEPYHVHPFAVAKLVASVPYVTQQMIAAAYLHDVVEDTHIGFSMIDTVFGPTVCKYVYLLSDMQTPADGNREFRKGVERERLAGAPPEVQTIKLADLIDNGYSIMAHDPDFAKVYLHEKRLLLAVMDKGDPTLYRRAYDIAHAPTTKE